jgi:hypothetical protein
MKSMCQFVKQQSTFSPANKVQQFSDYIDSTNEQSRCRTATKITENNAAKMSSILSLNREMLAMHIAYTIQSFTTVKLTTALAFTLFQFHIGTVGFKS